MTDLRAREYLEKLAQHLEDRSWRDPHTGSHMQRTVVLSVEQADWLLAALRERSEPDGWTEVECDQIPCGFRRAAPPVEGPAWDDADEATASVLLHQYETWLTDHPDTSKQDRALRMQYLLRSHGLVTLRDESQYTAPVESPETVAGYGIVWREKRGNLRWTILSTETWDKRDRRVGTHTPPTRQGFGC